MDIKITSQTETEAKLTISLNEAELAIICEHVFDELRPKVKVAGFRPGKAPNVIVERELGSSVVQGEVIEHAVQDTYIKAIRGQNLQTVSSPQVSVEKFVPYTELEYVATVELMPKVKLANYQDFRIKHKDPKIDETEVDKTIEDLRRREAVRLEVERPAVKGDEVVFDFDGTKDGEAVRGASAKGQTLLLGSGQFIPGFEEEVVGLSVGDEKTFDIRFPKEYHEATLAGKVVTFSIKLNKVTELVEPTLDDDLAAKVGPFKSVKELRNDITRQLEEKAVEGASSAYEQELLEKLLKESTFAAPDSLVKQQLERLHGELEQNLAYSGLNLEKYLEMSNKTQADMDKEMRPEAEKRVGLAMILTEVATAEKLSVSAEELDIELERLKGQYPDTQTQSELDNPRTREEIYNHLMASRVIAKLISYAESA